MKSIAGIFSLLLLFVFSCKKESFNDSPDARLQTSTNKISFDTVFTSLGSVTQRFTIINDNDHKLRLSQIKLAGGNTSSFAINVDGTAGTSFTNLELNANDSMYVFVKVTIDPNAANLPFVVEDSIEINYNGNLSKVYLEAYGQNARFITSGHINTNTTWDNALPYVIMNELTIGNGATLTLSKGTRVYCNATAPFIVNGSLKSMGEQAGTDQVIFKGSRLDPEYKDLPGTWPGIIFSASSSGNEMHYTQVLNAYQALAIGIADITLDHCIIHNAYDFGLYAIGASVTANDCLISQCGNEGIAGVGGSNVILTGGGSYNFTHCTIATYANLYQNHKQPVLFISNTDPQLTSPLQTTITNCIVYGTGGKAEDELIVKKGATDQVLFTNTLYTSKTDPAATFQDCIKNADPLFDTINLSRQTYNFRLRDNSPAIASGKALPAPTKDLDGKTRPIPPAKPDMGCYQKQ
jgi:hypothetical protein